MGKMRDMSEWITTSPNMGGFHWYRDTKFAVTRTKLLSRCEASLSTEEGWKKFGRLGWKRAITGATYTVRCMHDQPAWHMLCWRADIRGVGLGGRVVEVEVIEGCGTIRTVEMRVMERAVKGVKVKTVFVKYLSQVDEFGERQSKFCRGSTLRSVQRQGKDIAASAVFSSLPSC
jgi:hypothetical protein